MKVKKITDFEKNIENPFLKEAVQQIQSGIVKSIKILLVLLEVLFYKL